MVARGKTAWNPILQNYFDTHAVDIYDFEQSQKVQMAEHVADGSLVVEPDQVVHNSAPLSAAIQLFGINKWASENHIDITIHLHVNDYDRHTKVGKYDGFAVYVPDHQYSNAVVSRAIGEAIAARLSAYHATSTLPIENAGVVEDQQLIATGSNNSADSAALLIEYGYIYEPQFLKPAVRAVAVKDYAYQTYLGLQDFFKDPVTPTYGTLTLPYDWSKVTLVKGKASPGVFALQTALRHVGAYPPVGKSFSDCPISGIAGTCMNAAIAAYQRMQGITMTGTFGPKTRTTLKKNLVTL
jgi:hypothetical protein